MGTHGAERAMAVRLNAPNAAAVFTRISKDVEISIHSEGSRLVCRRVPHVSDMSTNFDCMQAPVHSNLTSVSCPEA